MINQNQIPGFPGCQNLLDGTLRENSVHMSMEGINSLAVLSEQTPYLVLGVMARYSYPLNMIALLRSTP